MKTVLDTMAMEIQAQYFYEKPYFRAGNRNVRQRVQWYKVPNNSGIYLPRVWLMMDLRGRGFICVNRTELGDD